MLVGQNGSQISAVRPKLNSFGNRGEMSSLLLKELCNRQESTNLWEGEWVFEKYKLGRAPSCLPFRLFETNSNTSCEEDSNSDNRDDRRVRGPYRKYSYEEKMRAVERILAGEDVKLISRESGIPRRNLLRWRKNGCERKEGGGRPKDTHLEALISQKMRNGELCDEKEIRRFAVECSSGGSFKASKGWFVKFCHRQGMGMGQEGDNKENQCQEMSLQFQF